METITVHNSSRRSWFVAILGVALMAVAIELLVGDGLVDLLVERIFGGEEVMEARERVWAGLMGAAGGILTAWGVIWGIRKRPVLEVGPPGLRIALRGPIRPLDLLPWEWIEQVFPQPVSDGGNLLSSLTIVLRTNELRRHLPIDPWGARWTEEHVLRVLSSDWSVRAEAVSAACNHYLDLLSRSAQATDLG